MIPPQLQKPEFRFILVGPRRKNPSEIAWSITDIQYTQQPDQSWKHKETGEYYIIKKTGEIYKGPIHSYQYDNPILLDHIKKGGNYGVLCGPGGLAVLDDDSYDTRLLIMFEELFENGFRVRDHKYIIIPEMKKKIIFHDITEIDRKGNPRHLGELQSWGTMVVGPGSTHPNGDVYNVETDMPIPNIKLDMILTLFNDYIKPKKEPIKRNHNVTKWEGDDIKDIPISSIISLGSLKDLGGGIYQGPHPYHGSDKTGINFRVDTNKNIWYCFRCCVGGGPSELIAVMEGITDCGSIGKSCFTEEQGRQIIEVARQKYGLKIPPPQYEPKGWARSVSIERLAKRYNFMSCPTCNSKFVFTDSHGFFNCKCTRGNIKDFAQLIIDSKVGE